MNAKSLTVIVVASLVATAAAVVTLNLLGHDASTTAAGGIGGGVAGAMAGLILGRRRPHAEA